MPLVNHYLHRKVSSQRRECEGGSRVKGLFEKPEVRVFNKGKTRLELEVPRASFRDCFGRVGGGLGGNPLPHQVTLRGVTITGHIEGHRNWLFK